MLLDRLIGRLSLLVGYRTVIGIDYKEGEKI